MWHTFEESLNIYKSIVNNVDIIVDVGVQHMTPQLIEVFPESFHYLFEPAVIYNESIRKNYNNIKYKLINSAVSNNSGSLYQHLISQDNSGRVTHSHLRPNKDKILAFQDFYIDVVETQVVTLDDYFEKISIQGKKILLKIDIDGEDTNVILGAKCLLKFVELMIVECPVNKISERVYLANELGFDVWDIVSPAYYFRQLSQVDVFFINRVSKSSNVELNPWKKCNGQIFWDSWHHLK